MKSYILWLKFYSPPVYYQPPTLDGIISYCLAIEEMRKDGLMIYYAKPQALPAHLRGLDRLNFVIDTKGGAFGVSLSSFFQPIGEVSEYLDSWKKRFDSEYAQYCNFGHGVRKINTGSGKYRSYNMPLPVKVVSMGYFVFIGDGPEVVRLIRDNIVGIGKKVSEGWGWIDQIELKESNLEWRDVLMMRPVPIHIAANHGIDGARQICGWKPPYWERRNICECVVPST